MPPGPAIRIWLVVGVAPANDVALVCIAQCRICSEVGSLEWRRRTSAQYWRGCDFLPSPTHFMRLRFVMPEDAGVRCPRTAPREIDQDNIMPANGLPRGARSRRRPQTSCCSMPAVVEGPVWDEQHRHEARSGPHASVRSSRAQPPSESPALVSARTHQRAPNRRGGGRVRGVRAVVTQGCRSAARWTPRHALATSPARPRDRWNRPRRAPAGSVAGRPVPHGVPLPRAARVRR